VRSFPARLHLRAMKKGDQVFFYHSVVGKEVVGIAKVTKTAYPDATAEEGEWVCVDLAPVRPLKSPVSLKTIKATPALKDIMLLKQSRLSVIPLTTKEFEIVCHLSEGD
jgi:predicted RNA-binding protein with PUA-like domain